MGLETPLTLIEKVRDAGDDGAWQRFYACCCSLCAGDAIQLADVTLILLGDASLPDSETWRSGDSSVVPGGWRGRGLAATPRPKVHGAAAGPFSLSQAW
jgi:hypothetical protein